MISPFSNFNDELEIALNAVTNRGHNLYCFNQSLRGNRRVVSIAVSNWGEAVQFATDDLKDNIEIALLSVKANGDALQYLSKRLQDNDQVVREAIKNFPPAIRHASARLRDNKVLAILAIRGHAFSYQYLSKRLKNNREVIYEALISNRSVNVYFPKSVRERYPNYSKDYFKDQLVAELNFSKKKLHKRHFRLWKLIK